MSKKYYASLAAVPAGSWAKTSESVTRRIAESEMRAYVNRTKYIHVRVEHIRNRRSHMDRPARTGRFYGVTVALEPHWLGWRWAFAVCDPEDQFNKKRGREIAEGRMYAPERERLKAFRGKTAQATVVQAVEFPDAVIDALKVVWLWLGKKIQALQFMTNGQIRAGDYEILRTAVGRRIIDTKKARDDRKARDTAVAKT